MDKQELIEKAKEVMARAYAPYSHFFVGAALLGKSGRLYLGCNVENAAFGITNCAERTALFHAVAEGERSFQAIAIVGGPKGEIRDFCPPCGACRQALREFCGPDFPIYLANAEGEIRTWTMEQLLPGSFSAADL